MPNFLTFLLFYFAECPLTEEHKRQLISKYSCICSNMKPERVIIKLYSNAHFDLEFKQVLSGLESDFARNDRILSQLILTGSMGLYEDFIQSLKDTNQDHIASQLCIQHE